MNFWPWLRRPSLPPSQLSHRWRMRCRRLPTTRPTSRDASRSRSASEKSVQFGPDGARSVKNANYPRPPVVAVAVLVGPHTTPTIVNYKYMTSTL